MAEGERPILYIVLGAQNVYLNSPLMFDGLLSERTTPCVSETLIVGTVSGAMSRAVKINTNSSFHTHLLVQALLKQMYF